MPFRRRSHRTSVFGTEVKSKYLAAALVAVFALTIGSLGYLKHSWKVDVPENDEPKLTSEPGINTVGTPSIYVDNVRVEPNFVPMDPRAMCAWGNPGGNPWKGDTYSALIAMNIPVPTARELTAEIEAGSGKLQAHASNSAIWADNGMSFSPYMLMTFGHSLCYGTRANFKDPSRVEDGLLYSRDGYYVWVPFVCGNVTRLLPMSEAAQNKTLIFPEGTFGTPQSRPSFVPPAASSPTTEAGTIATMVPTVSAYPLYILIPGVPRRGQPYAPPQNTGGPGKPKPTHSVPEPSTIWLIVAGLSMLLKMRKT